MLTLPPSQPGSPIGSPGHEIGAPKRWLKHFASKKPKGQSLRPAIAALSVRKAAMGWPFGAIQADAQMLSVQAEQMLSAQVQAQVLPVKAEVQRPELSQPLHLLA
jgi:hypothetical protein